MPRHALALASLEALLAELARPGRPATGPVPDPGEVLELARAQIAHLASMLHTATATGGGAPLGCGSRRLGDVVRASMAASGLPDAQLTVALGVGADDVADARVQRSSPTCWRTPTGTGTALRYS